MYCPTLARASSSITPSSRSSARPAFANRGCAAAVCPMTLRCPKASRTQSIAALFLRSGLIPSADAKIATASKKTEGAPDSAMSATRCFPDLRSNSTDLWRNDCELGPLLFQRVAQGLEAIAVGAIRHQRADLSSLQQSAWPYRRARAQEMDQDRSAPDRA